MIVPFEQYSSPENLYYIFILYIIDVGDDIGTFFGVDDGSASFLNILLVSVVSCG